METGHVDGLYFAVPTRSAATELHARIGRLMSAHRPALKDKIVRALPGMLATDKSLPDYPPEIVPDYPTETWAVAVPKRTFAAPIAVGPSTSTSLNYSRSPCLDEIGISLAPFAGD